MAEISSDKQLSDLLGEKESAAGLDIGYYLHLLKRYLWLFLTIVVLATLIALFVALRQPKKYAARAVLQVEAQEQKVLGSDDVQPLRPDAGDYMTTIAESLIQRFVSGAGCQGFRPLERSDLLRPSL